MTFRIEEGLPEPLRPAAARLYLEAFGAKLGPILGRGARAERFLEGVLRPGNVLLALSEEEALLGLAGFHDEGGGFVGGGMAELRAAYGGFGALWRGAALALFERGPAEGELLMDGIVVAPEARGGGVGGALIEAMAARAARRGLSAVRLDVVDSNPRARALYARRGFEPGEETGSPLLRPFFGFSRSLTMRRPVSPPPPDRA